jgi:hypothetical protein
MKALPTRRLAPLAVFDTLFAVIRAWRNVNVESFFFNAVMFFTCLIFYSML